MMRWLASPAWDQVAHYRRLWFYAIEILFMIILVAPTPQIRPAILNAVLLSFLTSLDEVNVALFISGGDNSTVTRVMFNSLRDEIDPVITVVSTCLVLVSVTIVLVVQLVNRKSTQ